MRRPGSIVSNSHRPSGRSCLRVGTRYIGCCREDRGLAMGKDVQTDCSINGQIGGKTYCFGSEEAKTTFMKDPQGNLAKAQEYYSKKKG